MKKNNFFVISGAPNTGKTTLLRSLGRRGFRYVNDSKIFVFGEDSANASFDDAINAASGIEMFHRDRENFKVREQFTDVVFFDGSFLDSAFLIRRNNQAYFKKIENYLMDWRFNKTVFMSAPREEFYFDNQLMGAYHEINKVYDQLLAWYGNCGYQIAALPHGTSFERTEYVLRNINYKIEV